ncbi:MAG TPA: hypothetical protein VGL71_02190, partial [Urbifossiella sp.]
CQQSIENESVVLFIPLAGQVAGGIFEAGQEILSFVALQTNKRAAVTASPVVANPIDGDPPKPGSERSFALPLEPRNFAEDHDENFLGEIFAFVAERRNAGQPPADKREINVVQAPPVGGGRVEAQPFEETQ